MKTFWPKDCAQCGTTFTPTGANSKFCSKKCKYLDRKSKLHRERAASGNPVGKSGGNYGRTGADHWAWKNGISVFERTRGAIRDEIGSCERCGKDLQSASWAEWCIHHRDHDRTNNTRENFELLCKRCHQLEHRCSENLPNRQEARRCNDHPLGE